MTHLKQIDELSDGELIDEVLSRLQLELRGKCGYCGRRLDTLPECRFPDRHRGTMRACALASLTVLLQPGSLRE
jgi:hypothetical protein